MRAGSRTTQRGFTYVGLLALVLMLGIFLARAGELASMSMRREREVQLLFVGHQYREAIARFYAQNHRYPLVLEELLGPTDVQPAAQRYLRRLYPDPMTGATDWNLIPGVGGGIAGVASTSAAEPIKVAGFDPQDKILETATKYSEWSFLYDPTPARPGVTPPGLAQPGVSAPLPGRSPPPFSPGSGTGFGQPSRIGR